MRDTGGFHALPRVGLIGNCIDDPIDEFEATFLPNRPEQFFLRLEIIVTEAGCILAAVAMSRIEAPSKPCLLKRVSATEMMRALACSPLLAADLSPDNLLLLPDFLSFVDVSAAISINFQSWA